MRYSRLVALIWCGASLSSANCVVHHLNVPCHGHRMASTKAFDDRLKAAETAEARA